MIAHRFKRVACISAIATSLLAIVSCGEHETSAGNSSEANLSTAPFLAIFSAFPAEMAPILAQTAVESTMVLNGRTFSVGTLRGARVVVGITGVGLTNAHATAQAVLAALPVTGVVFSGTAGGPFRIGDVAVPASWSLEKGGTFAADPGWLSLASSLVGPGAPCLQQCTIAPVTKQRVCVTHVPGVAVGGQGRSKDPLVGVGCRRDGGDLFGCELGPPEGEAEACQPGGAPVPLAGAQFPTVVDNETAAVAEEAAKRGLRFIGFRGMSDGENDPLHLPGFPAQFFVYYRLAARNSAAAALTFVERVATRPQ